MEPFLRRKDRKYERLLLEELSKTPVAAICVVNLIRGANGATTYNNLFIELAADLMFLYRRNSVRDPIQRLSIKFQEYKIYTCRGNVMSRSRAEYFYKKHIRAVFYEMTRYKHAYTVGRKQCGWCEKLFVNLEHHQKNCGMIDTKIKSEKPGELDGAR